MFTLSGKDQSKHFFTLRYSPEKKITSTDNTKGKIPDKSVTGMSMQIIVL